jgi:hypothetical protein
VTVSKWSQTPPDEGFPLSGKGKCHARPQVLLETWLAGRTDQDRSRSEGRRGSCDGFRPLRSLHPPSAANASGR